MSWKIKEIKKIESKNSILIAGLPGVGNVAKLAVDFLIDDLKAKKVYEFYSPKNHNCVFINEENLIEMPFISIYHKGLKNKDLFFLTGDIQPLDGNSCYDFCESILDFCKKHNCKEVITLGGVGLKDIPKSPNLYFTGNNKEIIKKYNTSKKLNTLSGPIIGISGLLIGMARDQKIPGVTILAETSSQQNYVGTVGAREILFALDKKLNLELNLKRMKKEMEEIEEINSENMEEEDLGFLEDLKEQISQVEQPKKKIEDNPVNKIDTNYIG